MVCLMQPSPTWFPALCLGYRFQMSHLGQPGQWPCWLETLGIVISTHSVSSLLAKAGLVTDEVSKEREKEKLPWHI